jgi:UDP-glucose 4-epimerase
MTVDEVADEVMRVMGLTGVRRVYEPILHGVGWPGDVKRVALKNRKVEGLGFKPMMNPRKAKSYQNCSKEAYRRTERLVECVD